ncbi:MAG: zf-HC2 domain-containing protein [Moorella sp. (in: firmicutes)]
MKCRYYRELLSSYLDNALTATQRLEVEEHINGCRACREELEALRRTVELLKDWSEEELDLPPGFEEDLRRRLEAACRPWYRRLGQRASLTAAAVIMAVFFTALTGYHTRFTHPFRNNESEPPSYEIQAPPSPDPGSLPPTTANQEEKQAPVAPLQEIRRPTQAKRPLQEKALVPPAAEGAPSKAAPSMGSVPLDAPLLFTKTDNDADSKLSVPEKVYEEPDTVSEPAGISGSPSP